jgi:prophage regulatory protein
MLLSKKQVTEMVLYGSAHIDRLENEESPYYDPSFPKRVKIGNNRVGWLKAEVEDFIRSKLEQRDSSH